MPEQLNRCPYTGWDCECLAGGQGCALDAFRDERQVRTMCSRCGAHMWGPKEHELVSRTTRAICGCCARKALEVGRE